MIWRTLSIAACATMFAQPIFASEMKMPGHGSGAPAHSATQANEAAMHTMMKEMMAAPAHDADHDFAHMMLAHHKGAIAMAKVELQYGRDAELRALATEIVAAQEKEITQMNAWLAAHP